jgi:predicted RNA binding protein YcfA (HicA-like mRNA interferase family)
VAQEQLKLHAEAVERAEQRSAQRKTMKGAATAALAAACAQPTSVAAATSHPLNECKRSALSSAASSAASASVVKVDNSSDDPARAASAELSPAQAASVAELACSWTADAALTDVSSLLQTGRRKFGVIVKAAVKFLHSLHPTSVNQSGSHRVFHFGQSGPVTLVLPHAGRRSKDGTVSRQCCTQLYRAMQQATMSQFGSTHAGAQVEQAQPPLQLMAASSSASVAELA